MGLQNNYIKKIKQDEIRIKCLMFVLLCYVVCCRGNVVAMTWLAIERRAKEGGKNKMIST